MRGLTPRWSQRRLPLQFWILSYKTELSRLRSRSPVAVAQLWIACVIRVRPMSLWDFIRISFESVGRLLPTLFIGSGSSVFCLFG